MKLSVLKNKIFKFRKSYTKDIMIGAIAGLISGIFFSVYIDLRPQINNSFYLLGASLLMATIWYFIIISICFVFFYFFGEK